MNLKAMKAFFVWVNLFWYPCLIVKISVSLYRKIIANFMVLIDLAVRVYGGQLDFNRLFIESEVMFSSEKEFPFTCFFSMLVFVTIS